MLSEELLAVQLLELSSNPTAVESEAIDRFLTAYSTYLTGTGAGDGATANGVPINASAVLAAASAAGPTMVGMSEPGPFDEYNQALTKIPEAVSQGSGSFWGALAANPSGAFPGAIAMTPPPHSNMSSQFPVVMENNTTGEVTAEEAAANAAELLHQEATTGGTVTFPGPSIFPII